MTASERDARLAPGDQIANFSAEDQSNFLAMGFARGLGCDCMKANDTVSDMKRVELTCCQLLQVNVASLSHRPSDSPKLNCNGLFARSQ